MPYQHLNSINSKNKIKFLRTKDIKTSQAFQLDQLIKYPTNPKKIKKKGKKIEAS